MRRRWAKVLRVAIALALASRGGPSRGFGDRSGSSRDPEMGGARGGMPRTYDIAVVTKALDSEWGMSAKRGGEAAAREHPEVALSVRAPEREINIDQQVVVLEDQILKKVPALVVAPAGPSEIVPGLEKAKASGIPVVRMDTEAAWPDCKNLIGLENRLARSLADAGRHFPFERVEVFGSHATIEAQKRDHTIFTAGPRAKSVTESFDHLDEGWRWGYVPEDRDFIEAMCTGRSARVTAWGGYKAVELVEACYRAARTGECVFLEGADS